MAEEVRTGVGKQQKGKSLMKYQYLSVRTRERVGWLEYNHPPINAFNWDMLREVPSALQALLDEPQVRVVVFASAIEKYFSVEINCVPHNLY